MNPETTIQGATCGYHPDIAWKMEPALELWVDVETMPVTIRLAGVLDGQTGKNVYAVVEGLLQEGYVDFAMQVDELDPPDAAGFSSLVGIQRLVKSAGGFLRWSPWSERCEQRQAVPESSLR